MTWIKRLISAVDHHDAPEYEAPVIMPADQQHGRIQGMSVKRILEAQVSGLQAAESRLLQLTQAHEEYVADMTSRIAALQAELHAENIRVKEEQRQTQVVIDTFAKSIADLEQDPSVKQPIHASEDMLMERIEDELDKELNFSPI